MHEQRTPRVTSAEEAVEALIAWQENQGGIPTIPARHATEETDAGWAFFNVKGYLGTVTPDGEVVDPGLVRSVKILALRRMGGRELSADDRHRYSVEVSLPAGDRGIAAVLSALEDYVSRRGDGPAHLTLDGQSYMLEGEHRW